MISLLAIILSLVAGLTVLPAVVSIEGLYVSKKLKMIIKLNLSERRKENCLKSFYLNSLSLTK